MTEKSTTSPQKLILIDGYGFVFRAYHAMARTNMRRADGTPTGAVFAFTNMLIKIIADHKTDFIAVVFDAGKATFRNEIYAEYKANRAAAPEDLIPQFPLVREAATALNLAIVEKVGYEADDLIATYTKIGKETGHDVMIISSDKDLMQLIGPGVEMYDPLKSRMIGNAEVFEKFGVTPDKVLDVLALMGDSSDNIPGVPGIGPKTAAELINEFGDLEGVLSNTGKIKQNKRREVLEENKEKARLSKRLAALCFDVPLDSQIEHFAVKQTDTPMLVKFLKEQGFKSLISRVDKNHDAAMPELKSVEKKVATPSHNTLIDNANNLKKWVDSVGEIYSIVVHVENDAKSKSAIGIALSVNGKSCYLPLNIKSAPKQTSLFGDEEAEEKTATNSIKDAIIALKGMFSDPLIVKIGHDLKPLMRVAKDCGIEISPIDDIMMMSYSLETGLHGHDLTNILIRYNKEEYPETKALAELEPEKAMPYICGKSDAILHIHAELKQRLLADKSVTLYEKMDKQLISVLADMENNGIKVDPVRLKELSEVFAIEIKRLEEEIFKLADCEFNIGSPKQMGEVLFDKLGLSTGKKSKKSGAYSTDVKVLQGLAADGHEIASKILEWRHVSKIKGTYSDALPKQIEADGRIHTNFAMAATNTGRLSSHDPNLQNIPIRTELGNKIREAFIAEKGCKLISADYSQIELRLLAHIADIDVLKEAFVKDYDIHSATASQIFGVDISQVDSDLRRKAKTINFGIIYGISAFGLAERLGISRMEASDYIKKYFLQYPGIEAYMKETVEFARKHNYVQTIWGRKCYINGINDRNPAMRQFSERAAINAPLQGSAADIVKKAMIVLANKIKADNLPARILLQVHDELVVEVPEDKAEHIAKIIKTVMQDVVNLSVPATVDVGIGNNWREIH